VHLYALSVSVVTSVFVAGHLKRSKGIKSVLISEIHEMNFYAHRLHRFSLIEKLPHQFILPQRSGGHKRNAEKTP